ncbi:MAG TPA: Hsp20/alpha crystallin family protein [Pyrinomonadaceae bacterium]|jgi:HSP20 family protein|nr:Hsp20/alpha crystallin family protein [Pyrinomonadaceae bacterium]
MAHSIEHYLRMMPKATGVRCTKHFWRPAADVYKTRDGWMVKIELAGVSPDELEVRIEGSTLRVAGSRRDESCSESVSFHQLEITYSAFERTISFPCPIEGASLRTRYKDGLLILHLLSPEECD